MPRENHYDYLSRRERECRDAAERAEDPAVRQTHIAFAKHYACLIDAPLSHRRTG